MKYHLETRDAEVLIEQLVKLFARRMDNCHMSASIGTQKSRALAKAREATYVDVIETLQNIVLPASEEVLPPMSSFMRVPVSTGEDHE